MKFPRFDKDESLDNFPLDKYLEFPESNRGDFDLELEKGLSKISKLSHKKVSFPFEKSSFNRSQPEQSDATTPRKR